MKNLIKLAAGLFLAVALAACSNTPTMYDTDNANYGRQPTFDQLREGVRSLGGEVNDPAKVHLITGWATDLDNPGGFIYGWQYTFQQTAQAGGGTVTVLFHDGILTAATRETRDQAKPQRLR